MAGMLHVHGTAQDFPTVADLTETASPIRTSFDGLSPMATSRSNGLDHHLAISTPSVTFFQSPRPMTHSISNDTVNPPSNEYLSFTLGDEHYGVDILNVQEIRGYDGVTRIPDAPECIKGVINLRGTIVPVMDLRLKLGLEHASYDPFTVMIVINFNQRVVALVVDSVSDVIELDPSQLRPPPELGSTVDSRCISGIGTVDERMLIVLNIESLMIETALDAAPASELALAA